MKHMKHWVFAEVEKASIGTAFQGCGSLCGVDYEGKSVEEENYEI